MSFQWRLQKLLQGLVSYELTAYLPVFDLSWTQYIMAMLLKGCKPDNFKSNNSLKLSITNIPGLCSNFVDCESFLASNSPDILALCETNLDDSIDSGNFSATVYLPLIWKDSTTHMHGHVGYMKKGFLLHEKLCGFLLMFSTGFTSLSILLLFPLLIIFFVFMHVIWFYLI